MIRVDAESFLLITVAAVLAALERVALALFSATQLPLVVAITTIATEQGHMRSSTAAALVGAAILSTLIFPYVGLGSAGATTSKSGSKRMVERRRRRLFARDRHDR